MNVPSSTLARRSSVPGRMRLLLALVAVVGTTVAAAPGQPVSTPSLRLSTAETEQTSFGVASFNILGYDHTRSGRQARIYEDGRTRMRMTVELLRSYPLSVVGFQELQPEQLETFREVTGDRWGIYPADSIREPAVMHNSIAWRVRKWEALDLSWIEIPYFRGRLIKMPVVKLQHRRTGQVVYFANFHNPSNGRGPAEHHRNEAMRRQIALANEKAAEGVPIIVTGDMNETTDYFCPMTRRAPMHSASGGGWEDGQCEPARPMGIDWIFGHLSITFSDYVFRRDGVDGVISDHPFVFSRATIG